MAVSDHPSGHLRADEVAKGFHSTYHCFNDVYGACVAYGCGLVHIPHGGLRGNWARASSKTSHSHSLRSRTGVVQGRPKTLHGSASTRKACACGGGAQRADGGRGHVGDRLPLPEWEPFARLVALVAEGVQTDVDATMEALRQQHDIDIQAYKARIEHLETVLASLGNREPLELLPSTGGASTSRSVHDDQYTVDMFMENQQLRQNLEDVDRVNVGLHADLDNANRANAGLRVDVDHANRTNMQLHVAVEDMTSQLREQEGSAREKANDHSQLL